jgi:hypothetical protein
MGTAVVGIFPGQTFATADGEELTVVELIPRIGYAVVETLEEKQGVVNLGDMLDAIQRGALVNVDGQHDEPESDE